MATTMIEMKNTLDGIKRRLDIVEGKISEPEDKTIILYKIKHRERDTEN